MVIGRRPHASHYKFRSRNGRDAPVVLVGGEFSIAEQGCDAMVLAAHSNNLGGPWRSRFDREILKSSGPQFHDQLARSGLIDGGVFIAKPLEAEVHRGNFRHLLFVGDDQRKPFREILTAAFLAAEGAMFEQVAMPLLRPEKMFRGGEVEIAREMIEGVRGYLSQAPVVRSIKAIGFLITHNDGLCTFLHAPFDCA